MVEQVEQEVPATSPVAGPSEQELMTLLQDAIKTGNFKAVAKVSAQLVKFQNAHEAAELTAKQAAIAGLTTKVREAIDKVLLKMVEKAELDSADGIWYEWDFGQNTKGATGCKLLKSTAKAKTAGHTGGGGGKKFAVNTKELIDNKYGDHEYKDGQTFAQAWEASTDKNWRYAIREKILKLEGLIS